MIELITQIYLYGIPTILFTALIIWIIKDPEDFGVLVICLLGLLLWPLLLSLVLLLVIGDLYRDWMRK